MANAQRCKWHYHTHWACNLHCLPMLLLSEEEREDGCAAVAEALELFACGPHRSPAPACRQGGGGAMWADDTGLRLFARTRCTGPHALTMLMHFHTCVPELASRQRGCTACALTWGTCALAQTTRTGSRCRRCGSMAAWWALGTRPGNSSRGRIAVGSRRRANFPPDRLSCACPHLAHAPPPWRAHSHAFIPPNCPQPLKGRRGHLADGAAVARLLPLLCAGGAAVRALRALLHRQRHQRGTLEKVLRLDLQGGEGVPRWAERAVLRTQKQHNMQRDCRGPAPWTQALAHQ